MPTLRKPMLHSTIVLAALSLTACSATGQNSTPSSHSSVLGTTTFAATTTPEPGESTTTDETATQEPAGSQDAPESTTPIPHVELKKTATVGTQLTDPWGIATLPDDTFLVTEKKTVAIAHVTADKTTQLTGAGITELTNFVGELGAESTDEAGLYGIVASPQFEQDSALYVFASSGKSSTVFRLTLNGTTLENPTAIIEGLPAGAGHNGGALGFDNDGYLYISTGDAGQPHLAGDLDSYAGKILRIRADGTLPTTNPLTASAIWSAGHQNVTAFTWTDNNTMLAVEPGNTMADELNLITSGANYGWPDLEGTGGANAYYTDPILEWEISGNRLDPSSIVATDNSIYIASYANQNIHRYEITDTGLGENQTLLTGTYGRLGSLATTPTGKLAALTAYTSNRTAHTAPTPSELQPQDTQEEKALAKKQKNADRIHIFEITF
ncbi:PQQ-dependent sugar dehydrogenase [Timonella sp. A28]|uniref:PQQ-dependent sugar dehydrogenase n=1 Tax=Timonella sp. A28 TaxID=3442640 RepID=UPI003EB8AF2C